MSQNRRDFFKSLGAGTISLLTIPGLSAGREPEQNIVLHEDLAATFTRKQLTADVLVAGGGLAGVCAAIAAARNGARVILVQDRSRLGGNSSSEIRMHALGANSPSQLRLWRETGLIEEFKLTDAATNLQRSFEMWDLMLYDKVVSEKNITLLLDTDVYDAEVANEMITRVKAISTLLEEYYEIEARLFVDATGDATLAAVAGAEYMQGREGRDVYGESLAPPTSDLYTMGNSLLFFAKKHDRPMPFTPPTWAKKFTPADFKNRRIRSWEYGYWWIEWGGELDTIKDNRQIRRELMAVVMGVWDYIKNSGEHPDAETWALDWVGMIPGKRESRRILGDHVMIQQELEAAEEYPDRVAYGGWPMDDHPPGGIYRSDLEPARQIQFRQPYNIPLRSLYSTNRPNLLMAGRDISASHVAFSSTRVMATCSTLGQAVGTAAALCIKNNQLPRDVATHGRLIKELQQQLLRDDQALLNIRNEDKADLARNARITASAELPEGRAVSVIDGWNRDVGDGDSHQWRSPMAGTTPWIQLAWRKPQTIGTVQVTFDSGLNRRLYLTGQDSEYYSQIRGPQPEIVANYAIQARIKNDWITLAEQEENYLRLCRHGFEPVQTRAIRLVVRNTNGDDLARVFEIRCYA